MVENQRDLYLSGIIFLGVYIIFAVTIMRPVVAYDTYWHLQMGKDLLESGLSPWVDHYSITYLGRDIYPVPVIFQTLLYRFVAAFGEEQGFYFIRLLYFTLVMLALWFYFRKIKANAFTVLIMLPLVAGALSLRIILRPELFSFILVIICLILYLNAQKRFATKELLAICLLLLFWTTYHSPVIGYIIIFGLFLEKAIDRITGKDESFSWKQWFFWGVVIFLIGFTNLNFHGQSLIGPHFLLGMIDTATDGYANYIQEYQHSYTRHATNILTHVSWALSIYVAIWSLVKRQYGFAFTVTLLTFFSWTTVRLLSVVLLINMCVLSLYITQFVHSTAYADLRKSVKKIFILSALGVSTMALYFLITGALGSITFNEFRSAIIESRYPVYVVDYLKKYREGGNILNPLQSGGYLINHLSPEYKVYFDGRSNILYPVEFVKHNSELWGDTDIAATVVEEHDIDYVLQHNMPRFYNKLKRTGSLELTYADQYYMLFSRKGKAEYPLSSTLLVFPPCWNNSYFKEYLAGGIEDEIARAKRLIKDQPYEVNKVLDLVEGYLAADDKASYISSLEIPANFSDMFRSLVMFMAMEVADAGEVRKRFNAIEAKSDYDYLLYGYYLAMQGRFEEAEEYAFSVKVLIEMGTVQETHDKYGIMMHILRMVQEDGSVKKFDDDYVEELFDKLKKVGYPFDRELSFDFMCK